MRFKSLDRQITPQPGEFKSGPVELSQLEEAYETIYSQLMTA